MNQNLLTIGKCILAIIWLFVIAAVIIPTLALYPAFFQRLGVILVVVHIIEMFVYKGLLKSTNDYLQVLLFGLLHIKSVVKPAEKEQ